MPTKAGAVKPLDVCAGRTFYRVNANVHFVHGEYVLQIWMTPILCLSRIKFQQWTHGSTKTPYFDTDSLFNERAYLADLGITKANGASRNRTFITRNKALRYIEQQKRTAFTSEELHAADRFHEFTRKTSHMLVARRPQPTIRIGF